MLTPYRFPSEPSEPCCCIDTKKAECDKAIDPSRWGFRIALRASIVTLGIALSGLCGALAYARIAQPSPPIELGPAAIAKLRRPPPSLDPASVRRRAHEIGDAMDVPVYDITLGQRAEGNARRLDTRGDDLSAFEITYHEPSPVLRVRNTWGSERARLMGLEAGDEIMSIDGFPPSYSGLAMAMDPSVHHATILEVRRVGRTLLFCVTWR